MTRKLFQILVLACLNSAAHATLVQIGFEGFAHGTTLSTSEFATQGVTMRLLGLADTGPKIWALNLETYGQGGYGSQGNAIWPAIANVGVDDGPFFDIELRFATAVDFVSIVALDVDLETYRLAAYLGDVLVFPPESRVETGNYRITNPYTGSSIGGPIFTNKLGQVGGSITFDRVIIDLDSGGPELWDTLQFNTVATSPVPVPAALWLFGGALGALACVRRKQTAA